MKAQETIVSHCRETWIAVDNRIVFEAGKPYKHANTSDLAIKGESGIIMWKSKDRYEQHFINPQTPTATDTVKEL